MLLMPDIHFKNFNCVCKNGKEGYKVFIEIIEDFYFKNLVKFPRLLSLKKKTTGQLSSTCHQNLHTCTHRDTHTVMTSSK